MGGLAFLVPFLEQGGGNPFSVLWFLFIHGGFVVFYPLLVRMLWYEWMIWVQTKNGEKWKFVLLGINVPKLNEQSMVAIEQVFAHLSGPHQNYTWLEIHWDGALQYTWSLELASIDGYVQYMIRTNVKMRDVVEAAIYAQYPDAEIFEVPDYTLNAPRFYPDPDHEMWGVELVKTADHVFPIRTYRAFEHPLTGLYADPMAAMLEIFGNLGPGEQLWFQIVMTPTDHHWPKRAEKIVSKLVREKIKYKPTTIDRLTDVPISALSLISNHVLGTGEAAPKKAEREGPRNEMLTLTPGEKAMLEAVQTKITKIAFFCKLRFIYIGKKAVARRRTIISSMFGAIKQFNTLDMNGFKPGPRTKTTAEWLFAEQRKNWRKIKIARAYRDRDNWAGEGQGVLLNIEEIATLWHFPILTVKAPALGKAEARKGEPPTSLPIEQVTLPSGEVVFRAAPSGAAQPPEEVSTHVPPRPSTVTRPKAPILPKNFKPRPPSTSAFKVPLPVSIPVAAPVSNEAPVMIEQTDEAIPEEGPGAPPPNLPFV